MDKADRRYYTKLARYLSLNVLSMAGLALYILADTFFIARGIGENAIAALNLVLPLFSLMAGCGHMVGMGSATRYAIMLGKGQKEEGSRIFTQGLYLAGVFSLLFFVSGLFFSLPLSRLLGATPETEGMASIYLKTFLLFSPAFLLNYLLVSYVRNDGNPALSTFAMLVGSFSNVILDFVFIFLFHWGMFGASFATCLAPVLSLLVLSLHFLREKNGFKAIRCRFSREICGRILALGISSFITELSSGLVILLFNLVILGLAGNTGVASYGIVANLALVVSSLFTGVAQGAQPLLSENTGSGNKALVKRTMLCAVFTAFALGGTFTVLGLTLASPLSSLFGGTPGTDLGTLAVEGIRLYFPAFLCMGVNICLSSYFASVGRASAAFLLSALRGFAAVIPLIFLLSRLLGMTGVWLTVPLVELLSLVLGLVLLFKGKQKV